MRGLLPTLLLLTYLSRSFCAVNWSSPVNNATLTISESDSVGTVLANLTATADNAIVFTDVSEDPAEDKFGIQNTNELYLKNTLDYETTTSHTVVLRALDSTAGEEADITVTIEVTDENDESPVITSATSITLLTNTAQGTVVYTITSTDVDTVGTVTYSINSGNDDGHFILNSTTGEITLNTDLNITAVRYDLDVEADDGVNSDTLTVKFYLSNVIWQTPTEGQMDSFAENTPTGTTLLTMTADNAAIYSLEVEPASEETKFRISSNTLNLEENLDYETTKSYTFTLTATGSQGTSERVYIINVTDVNDVAPEFNGGATTATLDLTKDTDIGSVVYTAEVTDEDTVGTISFSITGGNTNSDFSINTTSGEVTLENALDPDTTPTYSLIIEATDSVATATLTLSITVNRIVWTDPVKGASDEIAEDTAVNTVIKNMTAETATSYIIRSQSPDTGTFAVINTNELVLTASLDFETTTFYTISLRALDSSGKNADIIYNINVTDVNDVVPEFVSAQNEILPENIQVGGSIQNASATDADTVGSITYSITGGNGKGFFAIDSTSGEITLAKEYKVNDTGDLSVVLTLQADDTVNTDTQSLTISFKSVPALNLGPQIITENVDTSGGYDVLTLASTDIDGDTNPIYSIVDQSHPGTFSINADNTKVITTSSFDREDIDEYNVTIRVTDTSQFELSSDETVIVTIQDVNDVAPNITSILSIELADDTPSTHSHIVYNATADDPDLEGSVTFSITDGNTNGDFVMNSNGTMYLANGLDGSTSLNYTLTITANDTENATPFDLSVRVITEPQVAIPATNVTIDEGSYTNHTVWILNSTDVDNDPDPTFVIVSQEVDGTFTIDGTNLITSTTFDFETKTTYEVTLEVTDSSTLQRSSTATLTVFVTDVNDEPPVFTVESFALELREDTPTGLVDYIANTTDADSPSAEYTIKDGNTNDMFSIDSSSGNLSLAKPLTDFPDLAYDLIVQANDSVNVADLQVNITVVTAPEFVFPASVEIVEGSYASSELTVLVLNSTDRDGDTTPTYEIVSQDPADIFTLNADNTSLVTTAEFDFESGQSYNVTLMVTDTSTFAMTSTESLLITVTDVNDNPPVFVSSTYFEFSEFEVLNAIVYTANTTDVDTESTVTYDIIDGNTNDVFSINATSGDVSLVGSLQTNVTLTYDLVIQANDTVQTANFNVTAQVKTAPRFEFPTENITISEDTDTTGGYLVWTISSTDADGDTGVQYDIVSQTGNNTFEINGENITTTATFDFETTQMFTITLSATDNSTFALSTNGTLDIYITDANDNSPVFTSQHSLDLPEFQENGTVVTQITSTDVDTVGTTTYSIIDGDSEGYFSLDSTSGNLTLEKKFDPTSILTFNLTIEANDTVNAVTTNLIVDVITVPEIVPEVINITENSVMGEYVVWNLTANDLDSDANPTFAIVEQSDPGVFEINDTASAVVTTTIFDFETQINYTFVINVTDSSSLNLSSSATFTVSILDDNDVSPNFTSAAETDIVEDTAINTTIYTTETVDPDTIGTTTYAIIGGNDDGIFEIDTNSGNITLNKALKASEALSHVVEVEANDTVNTATLNVTFNVRTVPKLNIPDMVNVTENAAEGTPVLTLASTDLDGDGNPVYELVSQSLPGALVINDNNTQLVVNASIDYETDKNFTVTLRVTETSDLNLTSTSEFTVQVLDANDKSPVFTSENTTEMAENTAVNETIYMAVAIDEDTMGDITYSITDGNTGDVFAIDPDNGNITLQSALSPTTVDELTYTLVLQADDSVNTATLNLTVDVKTAPVVHVEDIYIPEDTDITAGYLVWQINSTDLDGDEDTVFKRIDYISSPFEIKGINITTKNDTLTYFDFETTTNYTVVFNATDNSTFKLSSTATLTIYITDVNDNNPTLTSSTSLVVLETQITDEPLYVATAEDVDTVGDLSYSITDGNRDTDFAINSTSGELTLQNTLSPQNTSDLVYDLVIEVNDTINTATLNLTVNVKTAPRLNISDQQIDENTDTSGPYEVWTILWTDLDGDLNPNIEIATESLPGSFQVINDSVLVTNASFDYELFNNLTVTLRITDVNGLSSNDTLTLYVNDVNDITPEFTSNSSIDISEETVNGTTIYTAMTVDNDTNPAPTVEYSIIDGNTDEFFSIDPSAGTLTLSKLFDDSSDLEYMLTLQANDSLNVGLFNLTINVITVPIITRLPYLQINITENNNIADPIWILMSSDRDNDTDPVYVIENQSDPGLFYIDNTNVSVVTNVSFDFEARTNYTFEIVVTDTSSLKLSSTASFSVSIVDANDNDPVVTSDARTQVEEDTSPVTVIYTLTADDNDTVGSLSYDIIGGNDDSLFSIDGNNGNITLDSELNVTATLAHVLTLQVNDTVNVVEFNLTVAISTAPVLIIPSEITVVEGVEEGTQVMVLNSTDLDGDTNPDYEIIAQSTEYAFKLDNNTYLVTNSTIDYESLKNYTVNLKVTDTSSFAKSSSTEFTIYVTDANDNSPTFTSNATINITQFTSVGTVLYTATSEDVDTVGNTTYAIIGGDPNGVFAIDADNGSLTLESELNPTTVDDVTYDLVLLANDSVNTATLNLTVNVKTAPIINVEEIEIPEDVNTTVEYTVWSINSTDLDGEQDTVFAIVSQSNPGTFEINGNDEVVTTTTFDYETTKNYTVVINATDVSGLTSTATLTILITDVNDNVPTLTSNTSFIVLETAQQGQEVYTLTSEDVDTVGSASYFIADGNTNNDFDINATSGVLTLQNTLQPETVPDLTYDLVLGVNDTVNVAYLNVTGNVKTVPQLNLTDVNITENTDTSGGYVVQTLTWTDLDDDSDQMFAIVEESVPGTFQIDNGTLKTNATLDYEMQTNYTATISITDMYGLSSNDTFTLYVDDENDVTPVFTNNITSIDLWEMANTGDVYTLTATDPDTVGEVQYLIIGGNDESKFSLDASSGVLSLSGSLDFATTDGYTIRMIANDSTNIASFNLTVNVKTSPVINFTGLNVEISEGEDTSNSFVVLNLTSTDADDDADPKYDIVQQDTDVFFVDGDQLKTNVTFDRETRDSYNVTVRVTDSSLALTSNDTLTVTVTDVNDNAPIIAYPNSTTTIELREDTATGSVVSVTLATDADIVGNLSYSITGGNTNDVFTIDAASGNVTLFNELNATQTIDYNLTISVNDTLLVSYITVPITVKTAPLMTFPDDNVTIAEGTDTSGNYSVLSLTSSDLDNDPNPTYEILSQSSADTFFLSEDNTELVTAATFNYSDVKMYEVTIQVTDSSQFEMSSTATLTLYVTDTNNLAPEFTMAEYTLELPENQQTSVSVYQAVAVDRDTVGQISYSITGGNTNDDFAIDADSGNLTLVNALVPATTLQYSLTIQANDTVNTATQSVTVDVKSIPEIVVPGDPLTIDETTDTSGTYVLHELTVTDLDNDTNPTFAILSQSVSDTFEITNKTKITTTATFDFETRDTYELVVQVTDSSAFNLSSSATFNVSVVNADDEAPVFTSANETYLPETQAEGSSVYTIVTYDNDTTDGITYSIIGGNTNNDFSVDADSGVITLENELQPRVVLEYDLQLQANDSKNQAEFTLKVIVVTAPTLVFPAVPINEDTPVGTLIWLAAAEDIDGNTDPEYSIVSQSVNGTFEFNGDNSRLITMANFDYEETTSYEVTISVKDTSPLELSSTNTLTVLITDLNDVTPNFTSPSSTKILENTDVGTVIYTAVAEDPDTVGTVEYQIIDGNTNGDFSINATSGNITLVNTLNVTAVANYSLQIRANDTENIADLSLLVELKPDIDECDSNPCDNNATCIDGIDEFTCDCVPGYTGDTCDTDIDECKSDPCQNNATCTQFLNGYNCTCVDGYEGDNCETDIDECLSSPCQNGTCNDLVNGYNCSCVAGYTGDNCEENFDECGSNPCENGATCTDGINEYDCVCAPGYDGVNCTNDIDECASVTCSNNGTCNDLINGYNCTCPSGFTGTLCGSDIDECASNPCQNQVTCVNKVNAYECICLAGYTGDNCETDINECLPSPCLNGGNCTDNVNGYTCTCEAGYEGVNCSNECTNNRYGAGCSQACACNTNGTVSCNHVNGSCTCNELYTGDTCSTDVDECLVTTRCNKTNEGCDNLVGGFGCSCRIGYVKNETTDECDPVTTTTTTTPVPATQTTTRVRIKFDITLGATVDLTVQSTYDRYKTEVTVQLTIKYKIKLGNSAFTIIIRSLTKGSLDVVYDVVTLNEDVDKVAEANAEIATDTAGIEIDNETTIPSEMTVNDKTVPVQVAYTDAVLCQVYEATVGQCTGDFVCDVKDGSAACVRKDDDDNLDLILGLGIGIPAFFVALAVIVLCVAFYNNKNKFLRRKHRRDDYDDRSNEMYDRKLPVRANTGPPTWPFIASPEYVEYGPYSDYSREGGQRYLPSEDFQGQYDNRVPQDRDSNNYTWDYLSTHLRPGEQYQIRRPKVDYK